MEASRTRHAVSLVACLAACGPSGSDGTGGGSTVASTSTGTASASGNGGNGGGRISDPEACLDYLTEAECMAAGCSWLQATLFEELVCETGIPTAICGWLPPGGEFTAPGTWRRDVPEGRYAVAANKPPIGFVSCASGTADVCTCLD